jgi:hypothetical protein
MKYDLEFEQLLLLLGRDITDHAVDAFIGDSRTRIVRFEYYGYIEFKANGISLIFNERIAHNDSREKSLYLAAIHFYRNNLAGYKQYSGAFPLGIHFYDSEVEIIEKFGSSPKKGGGEFSSVLKKPIPIWLQYELDNYVFHFELDSKGLLEMVTMSLKN